MNVKALKHFYGTGHGRVRRGQVIEVSDASAKALRDAGLVEDTTDPVGAPTSKDLSRSLTDTADEKSARPPQNKMETGRRIQSATSETPEEDGIEQSTANQLEAGGADRTRSRTTASTPKK